MELIKYILKTKSNQDQNIRMSHKYLTKNKFINIYH